MSGSTSRLAARIRWVSPSRRDVLVAAAVWLLDAVVAGLLTAGSAAAALSVLGYVALAWRRVAPVAVFLLLLAHNLLSALLFDGYRPVLGLLVALFTVSCHKGLRLSLWAMAAAYATITPIAVRQEWAQNPEDPKATVLVVIGSLFAMFTAAAWGLGRWARASRRDLQRAEREAAEAVGAERRRIARELHDIVSHSVSVMVLQASGARRILTADPARADEALANIEGVGKQSMAELRRLLGVLDSPPEPAAGATTLGPQPGLADLPLLLEAMRLGGLRVRLVEEGAPARLDPSVDLSAYRIVQEALTNSLKHAGRDATATVHVTWAPDSLILEVADDGGASTFPSGELSTLHGLPGLRERARAVGGHLEAGPAGAGFRVAATLPLSGSETTKPRVVRENP